MRDYVDNRVTAVAVNLMTGLVYITVENTEQPIEVPLSEFQEGAVDLLPIFPPAESLEAAHAQVNTPMREALGQRGMTICVFYRGQGGLYWPSILNEQTLPRLMPTYRRAVEAGRAGARATAETGVDLLLWYIGARFPIRTRAAAAATGLESLTPLQRTIASEAQAVLRSKELATLRAAHTAGKPAEVIIGGRTILYAPDMAASGMTLFGENGFVLGREAFKSQAELTKTLLHELHRLATTASKAEGIGGALAAKETASAASFADTLYAAGAKLGLW
jgi:hypothetical protein